MNLGIVGLGCQDKVHSRNALRLEEAKGLGVADVFENPTCFYSIAILCQKLLSPINAEKSKKDTKAQ